MPMRIWPDWIFMGSSGPAGLIDATSKARVVTGAGGVCASAPTVARTTPIMNLGSSLYRMIQLSPLRQWKAPLPVVQQHHCFKYESGEEIVP